MSFQRKGLKPEAFTLSVLSLFFFQRRFQTLNRARESKNTFIFNDRKNYINIVGKNSFLDLIVALSFQSYTGIYILKSVDMFPEEFRPALGQVLAG